MAEVKELRPSRSPSRKPRWRHGKDLISCLDHPGQEGVNLPWWSKTPCSTREKAPGPPGLGRCRQGGWMCIPLGHSPGSSSVQTIRDSLGATKASKMESKHLSQQHTSSPSSCAAPRSAPCRGAPIPSMASSLQRWGPSLDRPAALRHSQAGAGSSSQPPVPCQSQLS